MLVDSSIFWNLADLLGISLALRYFLMRAIFVYLLGEGRKYLHSRHFATAAEATRLAAAEASQLAAAEEATATQLAAAEARYLAGTAAARQLPADIISARACAALPCWSDASVHAQRASARGRLIINLLDFRTHSIAKRLVRDDRLTAEADLLLARLWVDEGAWVAIERLAAAVERARASVSPLSPVDPVDTKAFDLLVGVKSVLEAALREAARALEAAQRARVSAGNRSCERSLDNLLATARDLVGFLREAMRPEFERRVAQAGKAAEALAAAEAAAKAKAAAEWAAWAAEQAAAEARWKKARAAEWAASAAERAAAEAAKAPKAAEAVKADTRDIRERCG